MPNYKKNSEEKIARNFQADQDLRMQLGIGVTPTAKQYADAHHRAEFEHPAWDAERIEQERKEAEKAKSDEISKTHIEMDKKLDKHR